MAVNEILPFAFLVNANIISQTEYQSAAWRPGGFVQGVAISPQLNKVWHQGSFVASALGQFVADSGIDVRDDGDVVGLAGKIANAIRAIGGGGGAAGVPPAPGMDNIIYGLRNQTWVAVPGGITLADVQGLLAGYIPITGGQMLQGGAALGYLTLAQPPTQSMHAATKAYVDQRVADMAGGTGYVEEAPQTPNVYGRLGDPRNWVPVVRADGSSVIDPGPLRIRSHRASNGIMPSLELQDSSLIDAEGIWRINVGVAGNWNLQHWDGVGWETEVGVGRTAKGIFAPRGGIVTGSGITDELNVAMPGSFQAYATVTQNYPTSQLYPELILGNLGTIAGPYNETFPRYGKWRMCVGAGGNLNFHHNTTWDNWGDFSTCEGVLALRHGAAAIGVEVFGTLQVDDDFILGRRTVDNAWIARPNDLPAGWKNLYFGTTGGFYLDSFRVLSAYTGIYGGTEIYGQLNVFNNLVCMADIHVASGSVYAGNVNTNYATVGQNLVVNNAIFFRNDGGGGWINCNTGHADFGDVYCRWTLDVRGPTTFYVPGGNDPVTVYCDAGLYARIRYSHLNVDLWSEGLTWDGQFMIADDGRAQPRMLMAPNNGDISFWGLMHANSGLWVHTRELGVNGAFVARVDQGCELHGTTNVYGWCYFKAPAVCQSYFTTTGADGNGFGVAVNNGHIYCTHNYVGVGNIWCAGSISCDWDLSAGHIVVGNAGVNVPGGTLWVNNSMNAWTSGGGELVNYWRTTSTFEVFGQFEAKGRVYLDGFVSCWNGLEATVGFWLRSGSLTMEAGDLQIHRGSAYKPGGGYWNDISSVTVKKEIADYRSGLDALCCLRPVSYQFNGLAGTPNDGKTYYGIVAEEALEVMPELEVGKMLRRTHAEDADETPYPLIDSSPVVWALVNAVKELAAKVAMLEARGG